MASFEHIHIFKTDIGSAAAKLTIGQMLDSEPAITCWHIDQDDVDCVLRVESSDLCNQSIRKLIQARGFYCEDLL